MFEAPLPQLNVSEPAGMRNMQSAISVQLMQPTRLILRSSLGWMLASKPPYLFGLIFDFLDFDL